MQPRKGCEILVEALEREGVKTVFAYPGGASMEIHQALTKSKQIRNILCRCFPIYFFSTPPCSPLSTPSRAPPPSSLCCFADPSSSSH